MLDVNEIFTQNFLETVRNDDIFHCYEWSYVNCIEEPNASCDFEGFYENREWKGTLQEATDFCLSNNDCIGITRSESGYEPRKGPGISHNMGAFEAWYCIDTVYNAKYQEP